MKYLQHYITSPIVSPHFDFKGLKNIEEIHYSVYLPNKTHKMLLYLSLFTIVLSALLFANNWKTNHNNLYLSFVYILMCLFGITHHFMLNGNSLFWLAVVFNHFAPLMFLIGPFLYFYVRGTLDDKYALSKKDIVHFIPAVVALIGTIPYIFKSFDKKLAIAKQIVNDVNSINQLDVNLFYNIGGSFAFRAILGFGYILYCYFILWKKYPSKAENLLVPKKQFWITYRWLLILLSTLVIITISLTLTSIKPTSLIVKENFLSDGDVFYQITGIAYFVLTISLLLFPEVLYGMPKKIEHPTTKKKKTISKSRSVEDPFIEVSETIINYLNINKPYLNPDFDISDIAFDLKIPQNHISYCISNIMNTRFSKLKSELRIQHAIELLKEGQNSSITIDGIGVQSGFKTRSYYYEVFKKETGFTPSEYLENIKK